MHGGGLAAIAGRPDLAAVAPFTLAPSVHEISLGSAYSHGHAADRAELATMLKELMTSVASGVLDARVSRTLSLEDVPAASE
ncbi:hypothetical protein ABT187_42805 [Streptomyces sp. NPDC001817]|uniref:hypothetical protein n=1 Tax=Streptomyces sp. NPDC001817 TaxID=3154398 RepID=UPI0033341B15